MRTRPRYLRLTKIRHRVMTRALGATAFSDPTNLVLEIYRVGAPASQKHVAVWPGPPSTGQGLMARTSTSDVLPNQLPQQAAGDFVYDWTPPTVGAWVVKASASGALVVAGDAQYDVVESEAYPV